MPMTHNRLGCIVSSQGAMIESGDIVLNATPGLG